MRWRALGGKLDTSLGVSLAELAGVGLSESAAAAVGLRTEGARRTLTLDLEADELTLAGHLPGLPCRRRPASGRSWRS